MSQADYQTTTNPSGLARQEAERVQTIGTLQKLRKEARTQIHVLIQFLDKTDPYAWGELEDSIDDNPHDDEGEAEPSLGAFDRMMDQSKAWRQSEGDLCFSIDAEQDNCDDEDSDPAEES